MDGFGPAVRHLGRIIERIDATDSSTEAVAQTFFAPQQRRGSFSGRALIT